jgi:hypothetical protein
LEFIRQMNDGKVKIGRMLEVAVRDENAQKAHYGKTHATFRIDQDDIDKFTADGSLPGNEAGSAQ